MRFALVLTSLVGLVASASAQTGTITYSFSGSTAPDPGTSPTAGGITGSSYTAVNVAASSTASNTFQAQASTASFNPASSSYFSVSFTPTTPGTAVQIDALSFDISRLTGGGASPNRFRVFGANSAGALTEFTAGAQPIPATLTTQTFTPAYSGAVGETLDVRIYAIGGGGTPTGFNVQIDNASYTLTPVPEPATVGLLASAGLGLAGFVRRRFC